MNLVKLYMEKLEVILVEAFVIKKAIENVMIVMLAI